MEILKNSDFRNAFLQGLAVVAFLYAVIFTTTLFQGRKEPALAVSDTINITRPLPSQPAVTPSLQPQDQVASPGEQLPAHIPPSPDPAAYVNTSGAPSDQELVEVTPEGPLPKKSSSGLTAFETYKKPFASDGKPAIAIAVLDYGLSEVNSKEALNKLPAEVSLVLNPYAQNHDTWKSLATAEGHEFWIFLPVENQIYPTREDTGPQALLAHSDFKYNQEKFIWALTRTTGYVGIASYTDGAFLNAQTALKALWNEGYDRGIGFFEINPSGLEGVEMNAIEKQAPYIRNHAIFDETSQNPEQWLKNLELEASNRGFAVGVIRKPYPQIMDAIATWATDINARGFALAPVSAIAQANSDATPAPAEQHAP